MSTDTTLYVVVDEGPDEIPRDQVVTFYTDLGEADATANDTDRLPGGTVYKLVKPGEVPPPFLDFLPMSPQTVRLEAARIAGGLHAEGSFEHAAEVVDTADQLAAFIAGGTTPADEVREQPFKVEVRWLNDEHLEIRVDGNVITSANFDEHGSDGLLAVEKAAVGVARALGVEPEWNGPGRFAQDGGEA